MGTGNNFHSARPRPYGSRSTARRSKAFTLVELLVVIAIIGVLIGLLLPAVQSAREAGRRTACTNNMKQLMLGVHNYMDANKETFPDGLSNAGSGNANRWGFIAMLLPFIEETALYKDLGVNPALPMPTVAAKPVLATTLPAFLCPSCTGPKINPNYNNLGKSNYACSDGVMRLAASSLTPAPIRIRNVTDGMSKTIAIGERALNTSTPIFGGANWAGQGGGFSTSAVLLRCVWRPNSALSIQPFDGATDSDAKRYALSSRHPGGGNVAMCDGAVKFLANQIDSYATPVGTDHAHISGGMNTDHLYQRLYVKDDGKPVSEF